MKALGKILFFRPNAAHEVVLEWCLIACGQEQRNQNTNTNSAGHSGTAISTDTIKNSEAGLAEVSRTATAEPAFTLEPFSDFPPEIDGCACYFASDSAGLKKRKYIYANNYDKISFVKINGVLVRFDQTESSEISKTKTINKAVNELYEMTIEINDDIRNGDETWLKTGTITIKDKNGKTVTKPFYGECGC